MRAPPSDHFVPGSQPVAADAAEESAIGSDGIEVPASRDDTSTRSLRTRLTALVSNPMMVAALIPVVVACANAWWIWTHRHLGGYDPDESSYLSAALRLQRSIDFAHPLDLIRAIAGTGNGITVPILSVPLLVVGPRDPRMAMMVQPLLLVFIGIATAGITRRLAGEATAVVAAAVVVLLPTVTTATQSYWYGLGAAAALAGGIWALLYSDRGANRRVWWFGLAVGLMLLSRTMTLGYVPACAIAGVVVAWPDWRRVRRVVAALVLGLVIAAPWYLLNLESIFGYLLTYGYGPRAELFGKEGLGDRLSLRWERLTEGLGWGTPASAALLAAVAAVVYLAVQTAIGRGPDAGQRREWLAILAAVFLGMVALVSTANNGVWFELPLVVLTVPILAAPLGHLKWPLSASMGVAAVGALTVNLLGALWILPWRQDGPVSHYEWGFAQYDERFTPMRRDEHETAAHDWWLLATGIEHSLRCISPDGRGAVFMTTGNTHLYNAGVVRVAAELDAWDAQLWIPDTTVSPARRARDLTPTVRIDPSKASERVLVVGVHDQILWPSDKDVRPFLAQARRAGYEETERFQMPRGGYVLIMRTGQAVSSTTSVRPAAGCPEAPAAFGER